MKHPNPGDTQIADHFSLARFLLTVLGGILGLVLGVVVGWVGGDVLDKALGYPMGRSGGFLPMGHLNTALLAVIPPVGVVFSAIAVHKWRGGRGPWWVAIGAVLLACGVVALLSLSVGGLVFEALVLMPLVAAVGLEIGHMLRA